MNKLLIALSFSLILIASTPMALAQTAGTGMLKNSQANTMVSQVMMDTGLTSAPTVGTIIATIIKSALSVLALIFVILITLSGFRWMMAGGNDEAIKKAQETIKNALIGLVITILAWAITYFIFNILPFNSSGTLPAV